MLILNFSHPLTSEQQTQIESLTGWKISEVREVPSQFDNVKGFVEQTKTQVDEIGLSAGEWQTLPVLVNPPAYNFAALSLLAELHGRMGYFPTIVRIRPIPNQIPPRYEVAEIINLQNVRDAARQRRKE